MAIDLRRKLKLTVNNNMKRGLVFTVNTYKKIDLSLATYLINYDKYLLVVDKITIGTLDPLTLKSIANI